MEQVFFFSFNFPTILHFQQTPPAGQQFGWWSCDHKTTWFFFFFVHIDLAAADVFESSVEKERRVDNCSNTGVTDALFDYKQRFIVQHLLIQLDQRQYLSIVLFSSCILFDVRLLMKATWIDSDLYCPAVTWVKLQCLLFFSADLGYLHVAKRCQVYFNDSFGLRCEI